MNISTDLQPGWLLLMFSLPVSRASLRVEVWRKLRRAGAVALESSGHVLPDSPASEERLQWLAADIRKHNGHASVLHVSSIDNLSTADLVKRFNDARAAEYAEVAAEVRALAKRKSRPEAAVSRLRRRFQEIAERDFFHAPTRRDVEQVLFRLETPPPVQPRTRRAAAARYAGRTWVTRPRPGVDRASCAWLIRRFIDAGATFAFASTPQAVPDAVPFDMFGGEGFTHRGDDCTFETLVKEFALRDGKVRRIAQAVHDADLGDEKFGRTEGIGVDRVLAGWAAQGVSDDELLRRGMELFEGLYHANEPAPRGRK